MPPFTPGLELSDAFFTEVVQPLLATALPGLRYSAALIGPGSEVLGYDTERSTDHHWGPRLLLFLAGEEAAARRDAVDTALRAGLPVSFRGYSTNFGPARRDRRPPPGHDRRGSGQPYDQDHYRALVHGALPGD